MTTMLKHRWSVFYTFLNGVTADVWWQMLRDNHFSVDWRYLHRAGFISLMSVINSIYRRKEEKMFAEAINATQIKHAPIFILGHWRSGTTHLHNLLTLDEQFSYPTVYQTSCPHTFLSTESIVPVWAKSYMPKTRLIDNMRFDFNMPQEEEFALCLACGYSSLLSMVFPHHDEHHDRYLTLRNIPQAELDAWKSALLWFLKKVTLKNDRALVLKSPPHTARINILLDLFPNARFIHIHRNPYTVFLSTRHLFNTAAWHSYLQPPNEQRVIDRILYRYSVMYNAFFEEYTQIPEGQFCEIRFEDLEHEPVQQIERIYSALGIEGMQAFKPKLEQYLQSIAAYQKNRHPKLPEHLREKVASAWRRSFEHWGYGF